MKEFIFPSKEIKKAVEDLSIYYQFSNQSTVALYEKWKGKNRFSGDFRDLIKLTEIRELFHLTFGKPWNELTCAIYLTAKYDDNVDMKNFHLLNKTNQMEVMELISKGQSAYQLISEWLAPLNNGEILEAIHGAVKVSFGNDIYSRFRVLKLGELKSVPNEDKGLKLFPDILEIDNPTALVNYFKTRNEPTPDSFILTFMRNKKYSFKPTIYMFVIWHNEFYLIDNGDGRLNLDNTAGARRPDKYIENLKTNVFLPFDILLGEKKFSESKSITSRDQTIFKRGNLFEIFEKSPEIRIWIEMFIYRILDYISNPSAKIPLGVTTFDVMKALEDKSGGKVETRVNIYKDKNKYRESFASIADASSYLLKKFESKITSIVPVDSQLPLVVGERSYIENLIKYQKRNELAIVLKKELYADFRKNHKRVYRWFKTFVLSHDVRAIAKLALQDKKYSYMEYGTNEIKEGSWKYKPKLTKRGVLIMIEDDDAENWSRYVYWDDDPLQIIWTYDGYLLLPDEKGRYGKKRHMCKICKKFQWVNLIRINFRDYRQICEFFNVKENVLAKEFVEHFHYQNEIYTGNSITQDTDPLDDIADPWFRREPDPWRTSVIVNGYSPRMPNLDIVIPLCVRCTKQLREENKHG